MKGLVWRWSEDHAAELTGADPHLPKMLDDRAADNWRPLKAIADLLGDRWAKLCSDAAEMLSRERGEDETTGVALLLALKAIFGEGAEEIFDRQGKPDGKAMHTDAILPKLHDADSPLEGIRALGEADQRQRSRPSAEGIPDQARARDHRRDGEARLSRRRLRGCLRQDTAPPRAATIARRRSALDGLRRRGERAPAPHVLAPMGRHCRRGRVIYLS